MDNGNGTNSVGSQRKKESEVTNPGVNRKA